MPAVDRLQGRRRRVRLAFAARILAAAVLATTAVRGFAAHVPPAPDGVFELGFRGAVQLDLGRIDPLIEVQGRFEDTDLEFRYHALTAGAYLRVHDNLKVGAFYRVQRGARHDDDWIAIGGGGWEWIDSRQRLEHLALVDVTPRLLLDFIPGRNWVGALKAHYHYNTFNNHHTLLVRPCLTYFWLRNREPVLNVSANYGLYLPLNFGETPLYEHTPYLTLLYHLHRQAKLELTAAYKAVTWSSSADALANGDTYQIPFRAWVFGAGIFVPLAL